MASEQGVGGAVAAILAEVARDFGMAQDWAERLRIVGEGTLPSRFPVTDLAVASIGAAGLALADLIGEEGGPVIVDRHLASAWFRLSVAPIGWQIPPPWDPIAGDYRTADGWIRLHTNAPLHRDAALRVLGCAGEQPAVAKVVSSWPGEDLETAIVAAGGCAAQMRPQDAWRRHPQGQSVAREALIAWHETGRASASSWISHKGRPLQGLRVLDLTRIIAGPVATRFLAGLGADVLRIDPPGWDEPTVAPDVTLGKRCARLDLKAPADRARFEHLLAQADVLVHGYRPVALNALGFGQAERAALSPGLVEVSLCAWGWSGPWAERRGFDSLVQMASGIADAGRIWKQTDQPNPLPVQALDHATGYLMAAAVLRGLVTRQQKQVGTSARLSLARTALALTTADPDVAGEPWRGVADGDWAEPPERTPWGLARRLRPSVTIGDITLAWNMPACDLGSGQAQWLKRL